MKKHLLTTLVCSAMILISSVAFMACGKPKVKSENITKADLENYIEESAVMYFNKGYKQSLESDTLTTYSEVVKNEENIDVKNLSSEGNNTNAMYIKDGEGFYETSRGLEKMNDISVPLAQYSILFSDCSALLKPFIAPKTTQVTKITEGNTITFTYVDQMAARYQAGGILPEEPTEKYDMNIKLTLVNNAIVKFEATSANANKFAYNLVCEEFAGPVNFSGVDLNDYVKSFTLGNINVTLTNGFINQQNTNGFDYRLTSQKVEFLIQHQTLSSSPSMTSEQYAKSWEQSIKTSVLSSEVIKDTPVYVKYNNIAGNRIFTYCAFVFKGSNNTFYICQFGCFQNDFASLENQIMQWAKSITIA